jgi:hypothetical protein
LTVETAKGMAGTAWRVLSDAVFAERVRKEWEAGMEGKEQ